MAESVNAKRPYDPPRRRAQAAATRRDILDAARRLFERNGYAATAMEAIASEGGVALKTAYVAFETKSGLLRALWNHLLRGGHDELPVAQQPWYLEALDEPHPERQLRLGDQAAAHRRAPAPKQDSTTPIPASLLVATSRTALARVRGLAGTPPRLPPRRLALRASASRRQPLSADKDGTAARSTPRCVESHSPSEKPT